MSDVGMLRMADEHRLLLAEMHHAAADLGLTMGAMEMILGMPAGALCSGLTGAELSLGAETQLRRLVEVAHLARVVLGSSAVRSWIVTAEPRLGYSTPLRAMQRPGGVSLVRELLRFDWDMRVEVENAFGCRG